MVLDAVPVKNTRIRLAALFHDVAKPQTREEKSDASITFYNHEIVGADICYKALKRLRFSKQECEGISLLVRHHMFRFDTDSKRKTVKKWMIKTTRSGVALYRDLLRLRVADRKGNRAKWGKPVFTRHFKDLLRIIREIEKYKEPLTTQHMALDGEDLKKLGFVPGPVFREILDYLLEKVQEDPKLNDKISLINLIHERFVAHKPNI
jgi:poly(A) polymerase/tRNA nucleotidyltransferase (CCA-adding enzyme)